MRRDLYTVVLALSGCSACPSPDALSLPRPHPQEARLNEPRYTESLRSLVLLEDLYFQTQRIHYLLEHCAGYGSIDLAQGNEDLSTWSKRLSRRIGERLEETRMEGTSWRVTPRLLNDIETQARQSARRSFSEGPINLTPALQRLATYAFKYNESGLDTQWLVQEDPTLSTLLVESGHWSEY